MALADMICEVKYLKESSWFWRRQEMCVPSRGFQEGASKTCWECFYRREFLKILVLKTRTLEAGKGKTGLGRNENAYIVF